MANIEELIFYDRKIQKELSHHYSFFANWKLGQMTPSFRPAAKKAVIDFLNSLTDDDTRILSTYFNEDVQIERLDYKLVKNVSGGLSDVDLSEIIGFWGMAAYRDADNIYLTFWK